MPLALEAQHLNPACWASPGRRAATELALSHHCFFFFFFFHFLFICIQFLKVMLH